MTNLKDDLNKRNQQLQTQQTEKPKTFADYLKEKSELIEQALPEHVNIERFSRIVMTEFTSNKALQQCYVPTVLGAVMQAAQLGLEVGGVVGHAYLVPFKNTKKGRTDCQLVIGYKGYIQLLRNTGQIITAAAYPVYENDDFTYKRGLEQDTFEHATWEELGKDEPGKFKGAYFLVRFKDGGYFIWHRSAAWIEARKARSKNADGAIWRDNPEAMRLKTVVRDAMKWLPLSAEVVRNTAADGAIHEDIKKNLVDDVIDLGDDDIQWGDAKEGSTPNDGAQNQANS